MYQPLDPEEDARVDRTHGLLLLGVAAFFVPVLVLGYGWIGLDLYNALIPGSLAAFGVALTVPPDWTMARRVLRWTGIVQVLAFAVFVVRANLAG